MSFVLTTDIILEDAERITIFRGDGNYALTSFIREVETVLIFLESQPDVKSYVFKRIVLNKIQGEALNVLRSLGPNPSWGETKNVLISNFGVKESYMQLYQQAFAAKNVNIVTYYNYLRDILDKINEKYDCEIEKPFEFSPLNAEKIIFRTFINNINSNLASIVINRKIDRLRDAYNLLEREGLIRSNVKRSNKKYNRNAKGSYCDRNYSMDRNICESDEVSKIYVENIESNNFDNLNYNKLTKENMDLNSILISEVDMKSGPIVDSEYIISFGNQNELVCTTREIVETDFVIDNQETKSGVVDFCPETDEFICNKNLCKEYRDPIENKNTMDNVCEESSENTETLETLCSLEEKVCSLSNIESVKFNDARKKRGYGFRSIQNSKDFNDCTFIVKSIIDLMNLINIGGKSKIRMAYAEFLGHNSSLNYKVRSRKCKRGKKDRNRKDENNGYEKLNFKYRRKNY